MGSEDTEFGRRLLRGNETIAYNPGMIVSHPVERERATQRYFRRWYFNYGRATVRQRERSPASRIRVLKAALQRLVRSGVHSALARQAEQRTFYQFAACEALGQIREAFRPVTNGDEAVIPQLPRRGEYA
jgi:hypothetical protein